MVPIEHYTDSLAFVSLAVGKLIGDSWFMLRHKACTGMNRTLHSHQELAIGMLRQSLGSGSKRPVLQAPTGSREDNLSSSHHRDGTGEGQAGAVLRSSAKLD
jgi:hypothetical protein